MKTKIFIVKDDYDNEIIQSKNPEIYYIQIIQYRISTNRSGFAARKKFVHFVKGALEDLRFLLDQKRSTFEGNILVEESTEPFGNDPSKNLKIAGSTGIVLHTEDGEPIYRRTFWDESGLLEDILIPHGNSDEIKKHIKKSKPVKKKVKKVSELKADASMLKMDFDAMEKADIVTEENEKQVDNSDTKEDNNDNYLEEGDDNNIYEEEEGEVYEEEDEDQPLFVID